MKKLAACMLLCLLAVLAATAGAEGFGFDAATGTITGWQGTEMQLTIPESINSIPVSHIGAGAFAGNALLETVSFPENLLTVGQGAFSGCSNLCYLVFQNTLLPQLAPDAFEGCPLADVDLPWDATRDQTQTAQDIISNLGFSATVWQANVPGLELPLGDYLYEKNGRKGYAFTAYGSGQEALLLHYGLIEQDGTSVPVYGLGDGVFREQKQLKRFGVPHSGQFTVIGSEAFAESGLEWIDLYDTVTEIGESAFRNCTSLSSLSLTPSLQKVGAGAFSGCTGLTELAIACNNSVLPRNVFSDCTALTTVTVDTAEIREGLLQNLPVTTLTFGENVEVIGKNAFRGTGITELVLPENIRRVESGAFDNCIGLESVTILCDASALPSGAFAGCPGLKTVTIAKGSVPVDFLKESSIETLILHEMVTEIGQRAFSGTAVNGVVLPAGVKLGTGAFAGVEAENIRMSDAATDQQLDAASAVLQRPWFMPLLRESDQSTLMTMPDVPVTETGFTFDAATGTILSYQGSERVLVIPRKLEGVRVRKIASLLDDSGNPQPFEGVLIPETVTEILPGALRDCAHLRTALCYGPLDSLGAEAFADCTSLTEAVFVNGLCTVGDSAFDGCTSLSTLWWGGTVQQLGRYALRATALDSFALRVRRIGEGAFSGCTALRALHLRSCTENIETMALDGCSSLETICFEWNDDSIFSRFARLGTVSPEAQVVLPAATKLKEKQAMYRILSTGNGGPVVLRDDILLMDCTVPQPQMPDVESLLQLVFSESKLYGRNESWSLKSGLPNACRLRWITTKLPASVCL